MGLFDLGPSEKRVFKAPDDSELLGPRWEGAVCAERVMHYYNNLVALDEQDLEIMISLRKCIST